MSRRTCFALAVVFSTVASLGPGGCGGQQPPQVGSGARTADGSPAPPANQPAGHTTTEQPSPPSTPVKRKIIYTAAVDVVVGDLDAARGEVDKLLAKYEGYVAKSDVRNDTGSRRTATYTLRVPVDSFRPLMDALLALGTAERNAVDSQDVTEEYFDLDARIKTLRAEEEVLNKLLRESGSRDDVLKTREQITRIAEQIKQAEVRLNTLSKLAALSTVNLTLKEIKDYKPPTAPTFGERVSRRFGGSWEAFVGFVQDVALFAVGLTPWLPVLVPLGIGGFFAGRKLVRAMNAPPTPHPHWHPRRAHPVAEPPRATAGHDAPADAQGLEPPPGEAPRPE